MAEKKKSALQKRLKQNEGVKSGTVRMGAAGKGLRKYNAKTGRWEKIGYGSRTGAKSTATPKSLQPIAAKSPVGSRAKTSGTVASAIARGKAQGPTRSELPTSSLNKASLIKRISGLEKSLSALRSRQAVSSGLAANKAQNQKEINRLEAELKRLKGKK